MDDGVTKSPAVGCERISTLALLLHLHRLELKSSEERRQFEEAADGRRTEFDAEQPKK